ncbi:hypothetical protein BWI93_10170 [Siphonobacter sp. BAB-5385]|uniref:hypothetical protein n=1 Tax=Siphonobacter sp. BAB-5385 TaxID=1864822 RepID=UPI000B9EA9B9|nr:hypothetical protein [Siphonobacter sp. BAB-5385]OZI08223.1 hypothetical protein BWI93_10170 [Siphonobacter sp. BAB-5385]
MVYETEDGELLKGNSPTEILEDLRNGSRFAADQELEAFLDKFVIRIHEFYGTLITSRDHAQIVSDLVTIGYLSRKE